MLLEQIDIWNTISRHTNSDSYDPPDPPCRFTESLAMGASILDTFAWEEQSILGRCGFMLFGRTTTDTSKHKFVPHYNNWTCWLAPWTAAIQMES